MFLLQQTSHIRNIHIYNTKGAHIAYIYTNDIITEPDLLLQEILMLIIEFCLILLSIVKS